MQKWWSQFLPRTEKILTTCPKRSQMPSSRKQSVRNGSSIRGRGCLQSVGAAKVKRRSRMKRGTDVRVCSRSSSCFNAAEHRAQPKDDVPAPMFVTTGNGTTTARVQNKSSALQVRACLCVLYFCACKVKLKITCQTRHGCGARARQQAKGKCPQRLILTIKSNNIQWNFTLLSSRIHLE